MAAIICLVATLFYPLGVNYTPLNDGWVQVEAALSGRYAIPNLVDQIFSWGHIKSRFILHILLSIYYLTPPENFFFLKFSLFASYVAALFGIFTVLRLFFAPFVSLAGVVIFACFPFDGSPFWIAAAFIYVGFALAIWSIYFALLSFKEGGKGKLALACLLIILSNYTYPGYFLLPPAIIFIYAIANYHQNRRNAVPYAIYIIAYLVSLRSTIEEMSRGAGRNSHILDVDIFSTLAGVAHAFRTLFFESIRDVILTDWRFPIFAIVSSLFIALFFFLMSTAHEDDKMRQWHSKRGVLFGVFAAVTLVVAGYLPYGVTNLRFRVERELLFARVGVIVVAAVLLSLVLPWIWKFRWGRIITLVMAFVTTCFQLNNKMEVAEVYGTASAQERTFFAEMSRVIPGYPEGTDILILMDAPSFLAPPAQMLINRPAWPLRYVYDDDALQAIAVDRYRVRRFLRYDPETKILTHTLRGDLSTEKLVAVRYSKDQRMTPLEEIEVSDETGKSWIVPLPGLRHVQPTELNSRQKWFIRNQ